MAMIAASFQKANTGVCVGGQTVSQYAAGRASADDEIVVGGQGMLPLLATSLPQLWLLAIVCACLRKVALCVLQENYLSIYDRPCDLPPI